MTARIRPVAWEDAWLSWTAAAEADTGPVVASRETFDLRRAWIACSRTPGVRRFSMRGMDGRMPLHGSGMLTVSPMEALTFRGRAATGQTSLYSGVIISGEYAVVYCGSGREYFDDRHQPLGCSGDEHGVLAGAVTIPRTARVGDSGPLYRFDLYEDASGARCAGTRSASYALLADSACTALLKLSIRILDASGEEVSVCCETWRVTPQGQATALRETSTFGTSLVTLCYEGA